MALYGVYGLFPAASDYCLIARLVEIVAKELRAVMFIFSNKNLFQGNFILSLAWIFSGHYTIILLQEYDGRVKCSLRPCRSGKRERSPPSMEGRDGVHVFSST
jgi:hypothetical protein